ncbi:MAG: hypothetical protein EXS25_04005 [Pedosphaera sp.]|nr:hypothetical protein [Pedosphaera sp.]
MNFNNAAGALPFVEVGAAAAEYRPDGGATGAAGDGYLSITDAKGGQKATVVFDDLDKGLVVKAFIFEADLRIGGGTGRPADGFSLNYVRAGDQIITDGGPYAGTEGEANLPEEGSATGLGIGFDTWQSGNHPGGITDVVGISIRVDNVLITQLPVPLQPNNVWPGGTYDEVPYRNLAVGNANYAKSMQTGALSDLDLNGDEVVDGGDAGAPQPPYADDPVVWGKWVKNLKWEKLRAEITEEGKIKLAWKGIELTPAGGLQTTFTPSAGRLVFGGRTGGAWEVHHVDNIYLATIPSDTAILGAALGNPLGFTIEASDSGASKVVAGSVAVKLDGAVVVVKESTTDGRTIWTYAGSDLFASGSMHTVDVSFREANGKTVAGARSFTVAAYKTIPATAATTAPVSGSGFKAYIKQSEAARGPGDSNITPNAETQAGDNYLGADGKPLPNVADLSGATADGSFLITDVINFDQDGADQGNFRSTGADQLGVADANIPGIPGTTSSTDNITGEFLTFLKLKKGLIKMGVNSDDGFKVSVFNGFDSLGQVVGEFSGGRGASDSIFEFAVEADGTYPFRLLWWEGGGGANVEWFVIDSANKKWLINQAGSPITANSVGKTGAYIKSFFPTPGYSGGSKSLKVVLVDDLTTVDQASIKLVVDGVAVTPTVSKAGALTTVTYTANGLAFGSQHPGTFSYKTTGATTARAVAFTLWAPKVSPADLSAKSFWIEAEDFNYEGGKSAPVASVMPYLGGAYDGLAGTLNVDFFDNDGNDSNVYRPDEAPNNVNMNDNLGGQFGKDRPGNVTMTASYKIGWVGNNKWFNYTRTIPAGFYNVYAALSYDGTADNQLRAKLSKVSTGAGTQVQTLEDVGTFAAPGSGGWGRNDLVIMKSGDGSEGILKIKGTAATTLRFTTDSGDFDHFILTPAIAPAKLTTVSPANGADVARNTAFSAQILDLATTVVAGSVVMTVDGAVVKSTVTKVDDTTTVAYAPGTFGVGVREWELSFKDSAGATAVAKGSFSVNPLGSPGQFVIETEDFNFEGGKTKDIASVMPYVGGAYAGLSAVHNIDYKTDDGDDSNEYRKGEKPNKNMNGNNDAGRGNRGSWTVADNYKLGWVDANDWQNYTRTIPAGNYEVWLALSFDSRNVDDSRGSMDVVTSDPAVNVQTLSSIGSAAGPGTGGWGANILIPVKNADKGNASVSLSGLTTLRMTHGSGDSDFIVLAPSRNVLSPADKIVGSSANTPGAEGVAKVIDGKTSTKYLNFDKVNTGFTVTPRGASVIDGISFTTANDSPNRDPRSWSVAGSNDGATYELIASGTKAVSAVRFVKNSFDFVNTKSYTSYRVLFPTVVDAATANSMQVAEVELFGTLATGPEAPKFTSIVRNAAGAITITWTGGGTLETATSISGPWTAQTGATSPVTVPASKAAEFARIRR